MSKSKIQNLINEKNLNAQVGEIFRACYFLDTFEDKEAVLKEMIVLAKAEIRRITTVQVIDDL